MDDQKKLRFRLHLDIDVMVSTKAEAEAVAQIFHASALLVATQFPTRFDPDIFAREGDDGQEPVMNGTPSIKEVLQDGQLAGSLSRGESLGGRAMA